MPNICLEAFATLWIQTKRSIMREPEEQQVFTAQDNLEQCKKSMQLREAELQDNIKKLAKEAIQKKQMGDITAARAKVNERNRAMKRLDKLRSSLNIIDTQLDAIKTSELDKEIMISLRASSMALKKAGIGVNAAEVENVMTELDDQMREMQDVTSVLANPVNNMYDDDYELDQELASLLEQETTTSFKSSSQVNTIHSISEIQIQEPLESTVLKGPLLAS
jgi:hypothetical protein